MSERNGSPDVRQQRDQARIDRMRQNRSFVVRNVRMSESQRLAFSTRLPQWTASIDPGTDRVDWVESFGHQSGKRIIDIGFGMGMELASLAQAWPHADFLGVEVHKPGIGRLLGAIEEQGLTNIRVLRMDAVEVLGMHVEHASIDGVHLFFPDPWPKKRHNKRRLVRPGFPELVAQVLKPGGYIYMVTDWMDYAEQMVSVFIDTPGFHNPYSGYAPTRDWRPQTAFERKGLAKGHEIRELWFERS